MPLSSPSEGLYDSPCGAWYDLLYGKNNRGQTYQFFLDHRGNLFEHLRDCKECRKKITPLGIIISWNINTLKSLDEEKFAKLIRDLYVGAQKRLREFDPLA